MMDFNKNVQLKGSTTQLALLAQKGKDFVDGENDAFQGNKGANPYAGTHYAGADKPNPDGVKGDGTPFGYPIGSNPAYRNALSPQAAEGIYVPPAPDNATAPPSDG